MSEPYTHGGARPGSGRKAKPGWHPIGLRLQKQTIEGLKEISAWLGLSKSQLVNEILNQKGRPTMHTDIIKSLIYAEVFYPFRIYHKKGVTYDVPHKDFAWVSPIGVFVIVETPDAQRHLEILNPALIEKVVTHEDHF